MRVCWRVRGGQNSPATCTLARQLTPAVSVRAHRSAGDGGASRSDSGRPGCRHGASPEALLCNAYLFPAPRCRQRGSRLDLGQALHVHTSPQVTRSRAPAHPSPPRRAVLPAPVRLWPSRTTSSGSSSGPRPSSRSSRWVSSNETTSWPFLSPLSLAGAVLTVAVWLSLSLSPSLVSLSGLQGGDGRGCAWHQGCVPKESGHALPPGEVFLLAPLGLICGWLTGQSLRWDSRAGVDPHPHFPRRPCSSSMRQPTLAWLRPRPRHRVCFVRSSFCASCSNI